MADKTARVRGQKGSNLDMTQGSIIKGIIAFAIPLLIGNLFQQLYNMVDSLVVGNFEGYTALSAVGTAGIPMQILMALFLGIGTGATILVSQFSGANDSDSIRATIRTGNTFLMVASVPITIIGLIISPITLRFMNVPSDVFGQANVYLRIIFLATLPSLGYNMNAGILRGMGDSRSPLKFLAVACVVNIILDLVFVAVFRLGVMGVAIATAISQTVAWVYSVVHIKKHYPQLDFQLFRLSVDRPLLKHMVRLGLPLGFNNAIFALGFLFLNSLVNSQGSIFMAGATASSRVDNLIFLPITSFAAAATTFAGQNVGALKHERLKQGFKQIILVTIITNVIFSGIILLLGKYALMMFNQEPEVIEVGLRCIWWVAPFYWIFTIFTICNNYMNGAGEVRMPTISSLLMFWCVRLPLAHLLFYLFGRDYIYAAYPISWTVGALISGSYFLSGRWKRHYLSRAGLSAADVREAENAALPVEVETHTAEASDAAPGGE